MEKTKRFAQGLAIGSTIGLAAGIAANHYYRKKQKMSPDKVLDQIKAAFLKALGFPSTLSPCKNSLSRWIFFLAESLGQKMITWSLMNLKLMLKPVRY